MVKRIRNKYKLHPRASYTLFYQNQFKTRHLPISENWKSRYFVFPDVQTC